MNLIVSLNENLSFSCDFCCHENIELRIFNLGEFEGKESSRVIRDFIDFIKKKVSYFCYKYSRGEEAYICLDVFGGNYSFSKTYKLKASQRFFSYFIGKDYYECCLAEEVFGELQEFLSQSFDFIVKEVEADK